MSNDLPQRFRNLAEQYQALNDLARPWRTLAELDQAINDLTQPLRIQAKQRQAINDLTQPLRIVAELDQALNDLPQRFRTWAKQPQAVNDLAQRFRTWAKQPQAVNDLAQRFRNLAEQYQAVLEHWSVFWERVNAEKRNRWAVWDAWQRFEKAFVVAAGMLAELKAAVPPEVANIWIGPTELVHVYCRHLRVGEVLEAQAKFFHTWLPRVAGATNLHWIWDTNFYRYMKWFERGQWELRKAADACEVWHRKQEAEKIVKALQQPNPLKNCDQAEAVTTRPENPSATREETAQTPVAGDVTAEPDASRIMLIYAPDKGKERMRQLADVINDSTLNVDNKLRKLNAILPIPLTTSLRSLAQALGVSASAIRKTSWWKECRAYREELKIEERRQRLEARREHYGFDG